MYVEKPFRKLEIKSRKLVFFSMLFLASLFMAVGYVGKLKNGFENRFQRILSGDIGHVDFHKYIDERYYDCEPKIISENALNWKGFLRCKQSKEGVPEIILLGDSHAEHLFLGLAEYVPSKNIAFYILGAKPYVNNKEFNNIFGEILNNNLRQHVILTMHFVGRIDSLGAGLYEGFSNTIKALLKAGKSITLVGDVPRFNQDPGLCAYSSADEQKSSCVLSRADIKHQTLIYEGVLQRLAKEYELTYLSIAEDLCGDNICSMVKDDFILYRDNNHLNIFGSRLVGKSIAERLSLN